MPKNVLVLFWCFVYLFVWDHTGNTQGLLLTLQSGIISGNARVPYGVVGSESRPACMQDKLATH